MDEWKEHATRAAQLFDALAKDAMMTLSEIRETPCLAQFREEYENLHSALRKAHENERRLIKKSKDLSNELHQYQNKVAETLHAATGNQELGQQLSSDIKGLEKKIMDNKETLLSKRDLCDGLERKIDELNTSDQRGVTDEDHARLQSLTLQKELQQREVDRAAEDVQHLGIVSDRTRAEVAELQGKCAKSEAAIGALREKINEKKREVEEITDKRNELEKDIDDLTMVSEENRAELRSKQQSFSHETQILQKIEQASRDMVTEEGVMEGEYRRLQEEIRLSTLKIDEEQVKIKKAEHENGVKKQILDEKSSARKALRKDIDVRIQGALDTLKENIIQSEQIRKDAEEERTSWRDKVHDAEADRDRLQKENDAEQKRIESLLRERDILNKNVIKADEKTKQQIELVRNKESEVSQLKKEIGKWKHDAQEFRKKIYQLEKQREKVAIDLSTANTKYYSGLEELKARDERLNEVQKQIGDMETKLATQKNLYDAVVADRNVYSKNLIESNVKARYD
ncbi:unnamed protein product [Amoebophrya sp. A25]|nr:unnamed protein product [Amoebophrya sp. A25]|eukprot:GSA25T00012697001.1